MAFKVIIDNRSDRNEEDILKAVWYLMQQGKKQLHYHGNGYIDMKFDDVMCKTDVSANGTDIFRFEKVKTKKN